jgi:hypothetical protein
MERHLNLIKNEYINEEKRVLPRFPFCFLTFRTNSGEINTFEVKDISFSGLKISLKDGEHKLTQGDDISGALHWNGSIINVAGTVAWAQGKALGVRFLNIPKIKQDVVEFLSISNIVKNFRPLHREDFDLDLPNDLKYWLRSDGPMEIFLWQHNDKELAKIQFILMENFIEWQDGKGLQTGIVIRKEALETPLFDTDEFTFEIDQIVDEEKLQLAKNITQALDESHLTHEVISFIKLKLGH